MMMPGITRRGAIFGSPLLTWTSQKITLQTTFACCRCSRGQTAKRFLNKDLKIESDPEIKIEIEKRLKLLEPKPPLQAKCCVCGKLFEPERRRFKQRICQECRQKKYASQK
jgi:hypothetical protein